MLQKYNYNLERYETLNLAVATMRAKDAVSLSSLLWNTRKISFDSIVKTMAETGKDLLPSYRETAEGGLAKTYRGDSE